MAFIFGNRTKVTENEVNVAREARDAKNSKALPRRFVFYLAQLND